MDASEDFLYHLEKFRRQSLLMLSMGHEIVWLARYEGLKVVLNPNEMFFYLYAPC